MSKTYAKTPTIYQMEATECGAAALGMIFAYHGKKMPLEKLRIETGVSRDGCNMRNIMRAGRKFGFEVHGYRKDIDKLSEMPVPSIIHWNFNHFVVFEGRRGNDYYINDPAVGRRKLTFEDIDDCYTGVVMTFAPTEDFEKSNESETLLSFVMQRLRGQLGEINALITLGFFLMIPGIVVPVFSKVFIDDVLLAGNSEWVMALLSAMLGTMLFKSALTYYRGHLMHKLRTKLSMISGYKLMSHMLRLPVSFFDQRYAGDLSNRISNNDNVTTFLTSDLAEVALNCIVAPLYLVILLMYSPLLTIILLIGTIINLLVMKKSSEYLSNISMKSQQDHSKLIGVLFSGLTITSTLKASGTETEYISRLQGNYAKSINTDQDMGMHQEVLNAIPEVSQNVISVLMLVIGGVLVINGSMTAGMLIAYTSLQTSFTEPVNAVAGFIKKIETTRADMARVNDIMKYEEDPRYAVKKYADITEKLDGDVVLDNISFGYDILKEPIIQDFSFHLEPGQSIAFVGASGSGKSTVSKLCSGLYQPWSGEIRLDGHALPEIPPAVNSSSVSTVSQNITLFSGSIKDNLTLWDKFVKKDDIIQAAKDACIHDFITTKPGAYNYHLAEGGSNLSGGQRQRLEIARALVSNPSILIMDEATSALDPIVEKQILDNIKRRGCTCIIVAHRLSAIRDCDEIIVMDNGRIVQRGSHEELAELEGHYQKLISNM